MIIEKSPTLETGAWQEREARR